MEFDVFIYFVLCLFSCREVILSLLYAVVAWGREIYLESNLLSVSYDR